MGMRGLVLQPLILISSDSSEGSWDGSVDSCGVSLVKVRERVKGKSLRRDEEFRLKSGGSAGRKFS